MIHFILIRHGETPWTKERRYQGSADTTLTKEGERQIKRFVTAVRRYDPDLIFSSSLKRAKQSANILAYPLGKRLKIDQRLNELSFGVWEGKTADELVQENDPAFAQWIKGEIFTPEGGESIISFEKRVTSFINDCRKKHDNKKMIIVTHGGVIRMFIKVILDLPVKNLFQFRIDPGTITILGDYQYTKQLIQINSQNPNKGIVPEGCI